MRRTGFAAAFLALLMLMVPFAAGEGSPARGLCFLEDETAVYADASMETLFGVFAPGQAVYAEGEDGEGVLRIVFVYRLLPAEGWIDSAAALPLEGEALEDYLYGVGEDGMRYKNLPLLPAVFVAEDAGAAAELPGESPKENAREDLREIPAAAILRQPEDRQGMVGGKVTFSVEAENAVSYCWQFHNGRVWKDATMEGCDGPAMTVEVSQKRFGYMNRCVVTFSDGTVLFSDEARIVQ